MNLTLSPRMQKIADCVAPGESVADIGTDHAYIPIYLVRAGISPHAIASDIKPGPLKKAGENIRAYGLSEKVRTCLGDGFSGIRPGAADAAVIAGMGGEMIASILRLGVPRGVKKLILQPMTHISDCRRAVHAIGWSIWREYLVREVDKFYVIIVARPGQEPAWTSRDYLLSPKLREDPLYYTYLRKENAKTQAALSGLKKAADQERADYFRWLSQQYEEELESEGR